MLELEASYRARCEAVLTPERLSRALAAARLPLTRLELERVELDSADAAREAHLCVRDDGLSLEEVALGSRYTFKRLDLLAEDLPDEQRLNLLCAGIGVVQEPVPAGGVFHLSRVLRKSEPTLDDASVRERIERRILDAYFSDTGAALPKARPRGRPGALQDAGRRLRRRRGLGIRTALDLLAGLKVPEDDARRLLRGFLA
jgi:hypothetical protein